MSVERFKYFKREICFQFFFLFFALLKMLVAFCPFPKAKEENVPLTFIL